MSQAIEFYFDFISPFGWIAAERVAAKAAEEGVEIVWKPFLLKSTVIDAMGLKPVLETPLKGPYSLHDAKRQARYYGLSLHDNSSQIFPSVAAGRAVVWARQHAPDKVQALVLALYRRWMSEGQEIASPEAVLAVAEELGVDARALAKGMSDPDVKLALRQDGEEMIAKGVFGSPTLVVDGELFWGSDRVDQAFEWRARGGW